MSELLASQFSWGDLLTTAIALLALYFVLHSVGRFIPQIPFFRNFERQIDLAIHYLLLIYEPMVLIILGSVFVLVHPTLHGMLMGLLLVAGFSHMKNYLSGRLIQLDNTLAPGKRVAIQDLKGIILKMGRLGINLQTADGWHFMDYGSLFSKGYTLISGEEIGGFYLLKITQKDPDKGPPQRDEVLDLLLTAPYLDMKHKPEFLPIEEDSSELIVRISVKDEGHLYELMTLIREWGYQVAESTED